MEKKTHITKSATINPRRARREAQVRLQKILLGACLCALVLLVVLPALFARGRKETFRPINAACEAYRPQVEETAAKYGMSDYVDLILALMMQESSGSGSDVLQSAEGAFNTKYPQVPGGITDTSYSIQCGVQELKYALEQAGVQNPADISHIRLALQAYNFGADIYFSYMEKQGETDWSRESAEAFAQMASGGRARGEADSFRDTAGPWDYGDQRYPEHVLQYYHVEAPDE